MASKKWLRDLKDLIKTPASKAEYEKALAEMMEEKNDRKTVLIGSTLIENILRQIFRNRLVPLTEAEDDGLFERGGPLSTFSDLIRVGHAFGIFDAEIKRDLDRLREIRNTFAHSVRTIDFHTPAVKAAIDGFSTSRGSHYSDLPWPKDHPHAQFVTAIGMLSKALGTAPQLAPPTPTPMKYVPRA